MTYDGNALGFLMLLASPFLFVIAIGVAFWFARGGPEKLAEQTRLMARERDAHWARLINGTTSEEAPHVDS